MRAIRYGILVAGLLCSAAAQASTTYTITDLGTLGGRSSWGYGINNAGSVTGTSFTSGDSTFRAYISNGTAMADKGVITNGGPQSEAFDINDNGQLAGYSAISNQIHAAFWNGNSVVDLGTMGFSASIGWGLNNTGQVTGQAYNLGSTSRAFFWDGIAMTDIGTLGGASSVGKSINDSGQITGNAQVNSTVTRAFFWNGTAMTNIGTLGGTNSEGTAINNNGFVAGNSDTSNGTVRGFLWNGSSMTDLGTLGGTYSYAKGINNSGQVVGNAYLAGNNVLNAFVWTNGVMSDLNALLTNGSGWILDSANAINDNGQITGTGRFNGQTRAFLLNPSGSDLPEPGTALLLGGSLIALYAMKRKAANS